MYASLKISSSGSEIARAQERPYYTKDCWWPPDPSSGIYLLCIERRIARDDLGHLSTSRRFFEEGRRQADRPQKHSSSRRSRYPFLCPLGTSSSAPEQLPPLQEGHPQLIQGWAMISGTLAQKLVVEPATSGVPASVRSSVRPATSVSTGAGSPLAEPSVTSGNSRTEVFIGPQVEGPPSGAQTKGSGEPRNRANKANKALPHSSKDKNNGVPSS